MNDAANNDGGNGYAGLNRSFCTACESGQLEEAKQLLADPHVDPSAYDNEAIQNACLNGHVEVVKWLLALPRVNPSAGNDCAVRYASLNGHVEVVRPLLADPRVNPSADGDFAVKQACMKGYVGVVELLLTDPRVNPSAANEYAIRNACPNGHAEVVRLLLADSRVNPSLDVMKGSLRYADEGEHVAVVNVLVNSHQPQLMMSICRGEVECVIDGPLRQELNRWEDRSAFLLLLCVKRIQSSQNAARVSDVLREVIDVFARFKV